MAFDADTVRGKRFAIVVTRWNPHIVENLLQGSLQCLHESGVSDEAITVLRCPGAYEIPLLCKKVAETGRFDAIIALGAVIRGGTPHFEYVAGECSRGLSSVSLQFGLPVSFGVLTVDNEEQALVRSGHGKGSENKGVEAAAAALEMLSVIAQI